MKTNIPIKNMADASINTETELKPFEEVLKKFDKEHSLVDFKFMPQNPYESTTQDMKNSASLLFSSKNTTKVDLSKY